MNSYTEKLKNILIVIGEMIDLLWSATKATFSAPFYWNRLNEQIVHLGLGSVSITAVIGFTMGLVMTLQFGYGLGKFGGTLYVPAIVSMSLAKELAPIFTSLLVAGRIGSGMVAEIGSMNVTQQVDAIRALGTSPIRVLVVPRLVATLISLPLLSTLAFFLGLLGGMLISSLEFQISPGFYLNKVLDTIGFVEFFSGFIKTFFFAIVITITACYKGFKTTEGTKGVGESTTWVVVVSSIIILVSDFFLSKLLIIMLE